MRISLLTKLICPNTKQGGLKCFATKLLRGKTEMGSVPESDIQREDEIVDGLLLSKDGKYVSPIRFGVLSMLADEDIDDKEFSEHLKVIVPSCPDEFRDAADSHLQRLQCQEGSDDGQWNRDEMKYYDEDVATPEKREKMYVDITNKDLPHIFIPRKKHILGPISENIDEKTVIEIGCGNARTVSRLLPPTQGKYCYIGSDIAFWRLVVAKKACPDGEFVQASAFNLPFATHCADVGISFGMLHHLPRPLDGLVDLHRTLKPNAKIAFHEPVVTTKIVTGRSKKLKSALMTYEHSDHDGEIDYSEFKEELDRLGYSIDRKEFIVSPFRTTFETIVGRIIPRALKSWFVYRTVFFVDRILINSICRLSRLLAPRAVIILASRRA